MPTWYTTQHKLLPNLQTRVTFACCSLVTQFSVVCENASSAKHQQSLWKWRKLVVFMGVHKTLINCSPPRKCIRQTISKAPNVLTNNLSCQLSAILIIVLYDGLIPPSASDSVNLRLHLLFWMNCPTAWQAAQTRKRLAPGKPTSILEAIADHNLWFWHHPFGRLVGSLNGIKILN